MSGYLILKMFLSWMIGKKVAKKYSDSGKMDKELVYFFLSRLPTNKRFNSGWAVREFGV